MSFPNIPNITPLISVTTEQTVPLLLASIALEELALAHIMNAEAEKLQFVLGTLDDTGVTFSPAEVSVGDLLDVNTSVRRTLRDVIKKEMLLEFKFENVLDLIGTLPSEPVLLEQQTFTFTGEIQTTSVPTGATIARIQAIGAQGGNGSQGTVGGLGASVQGEFGVTPGESLAVLVGGMGGTVFGGGGGGGSFVWRGTVPADLTASTLLVAAGGGGGAGSNFFGLGNNGADASIAFITTIGPGTLANPAGGTVGSNGTGGGGGTLIAFGGGGGGAGVFASGSASLGGGAGGQAINSGGAGGAGGDNGGPGGFGGGGGGGFAGGGGGGYSGGAGGSEVVELQASGGGGGGSRNNGTNQNNSAGVGFGNGQVIISFFGF